MSSKISKRDLVVIMAVTVAAVVGFTNCGRSFIPRDSDDPWRTSTLESEDRYNNFRALSVTGSQSGTLIPNGTADRPNIVFIIADDQPRGMMGFENPSAPWAKLTPHLDNLAQTGIYFDRFYAPIGQCAPSRASMWTGLLPHQHQVGTNGIALDPGYKTLPDYLKQIGYQSAFIGKCHLGPLDKLKDYTRGFDKFLWADSTGEDPNNPILYDQNLTPFQGNKHITELLTDESIKFIQASAGSGKPFFLWLAHRAPHPSIIVSPDGKPMYPPRPNGTERFPFSSIPALPSLYPELAYDPTSPGSADPLAQAAPQAQGSPSRRRYLEWGREQLRAELHSGLEHMNFIDEQFGRLVATLEQTGTLKNTLFVYVADNGRFFGERGLTRKGPFMYDQTVRVPLIIKGPGISAGKSDALVSNMDLMPTVLDLAGHRLDSNIVGKSFAPSVHNASMAHRKSLLFQYQAQGSDEAGLSAPMRAVLRGKLKFIHYRSSNYWSTDPYVLAPVEYLGHHFEMYDLSEDPFEKVNLLPRSMHSSTVLLDVVKAGGQLSTQVLAALQTSALWQTNTQDPTAVVISELSTQRLETGDLMIKWKTSVPTWRQLLARDAGCSTCFLNDIRDFTLATDHAVVIAARKAKEVVVLAYGKNGNAGYVRLFTPPLGSDIPPAAQATIELE